MSEISGSFRPKSDKHRHFGTVGLAPPTLVPVIISMNLTLTLSVEGLESSEALSDEQCIDLMNKFDQNGDGAIDR